MAKMDSVAAARAEFEAAEAAAVTAAKRAEGAAKKAEAFAAEAAGVDPDDEKAFTRATRDLAEHRAGVDLLRAREAAAVARVGAAREALAAAEAERKRARLAEIEAALAQGEAAAIDRARKALSAFGAELKDLAALVAEGSTLAAGINPRPKFRPGALAGWAGDPLTALHALRDQRRL